VEEVALGLEGRVACEELGHGPVELAGADGVPRGRPLVGSRSFGSGHQGNAPGRSIFLDGFGSGDSFPRSQVAKRRLSEGATYQPSSSTTVLIRDPNATIIGSTAGHTVLTCDGLVFDTSAAPSPGCE